MKFTEIFLRHSRLSMPAIDLDITYHEQIFQKSPTIWRKGSSLQKPSASYLDLKAYYTLGVAACQDASHHQNYYLFSTGSQPKPAFSTGILAGGPYPTLAP